MGRICTLSFAGLLGLELEVQVGREVHGICVEATRACAPAGFTKVSRSIAGCLFQCSGGSSDLDLKGRTFSVSMKTNTRELTCFEARVAGLPGQPAARVVTPVSHS